MFCQSFISTNFLVALLVTTPALARYRWLERDGRAIYPRRFGQEHPAVIDKLSSACPGEVCGVLSGQAISTLLAASGECTQQDMADQIIDASKQFDAQTQANMVALAKEFRQAEKNTPPDFTSQPPINRNSVFCQKAPKNAELNGLNQAQDPANDPNIFFDPATKASVKKGAQANTSPFQGSSSSGATSSAANVATSTATNNANKAAASSTCTTPKTVTVTRTNAASAAASTTTAAAVSSGANLQTFTGALGGVTAPSVVSIGGGKFQVTGNAQFNNEQNALVRSCDVQHNQCANKANASGNKGDLTVAACGSQQDECNAQAKSTASR